MFRSETTTSGCAELDTLYDNPRNKQGTELVGEKETYCETNTFHVTSSPAIHCWGKEGEIPWMFELWNAIEIRK